MNKELTHLHNNVHGIEVPEDAANRRILSFSSPQTLSYDYSIERGGRMTKGLIAMIDLPPGHWAILFCTRGCTEQQAAEVVERGAGSMHFRNYEADAGFYLRSTSSLRSLLRSKGLDPERNILILKKEMHA